ncbi:hypothetical protein [Sphingopyxis sp. DBS4]|uniref:hypothetical protein n=1 Tax=Sphingopyxis sp. DBS4 TaxID=2968500 RepID=UPI00214C8272|nr:hypothetical protein [Sphingopyxis sp. DBS4]
MSDMNNMRSLWLLIATAPLFGCSPPVSKDEQQSSTDVSAPEKQQRLSAQRLWKELIRNGQGCPGHILRGKELAEVVMGNRISNAKGVRSHSPNGPIVSRSYYPNGRLESTVQFGDPFGRYWIDNQKLCHLNLHGMGESEWCLRLIRRLDGQLMEEWMYEQAPDNVRLSCTPIAIERLADKS